MAQTGVCFLTVMEAASPRSNSSSSAASPTSGSQQVKFLLQSLFLVADGCHLACPSLWACLCPDFLFLEGHPLYLFRTHFNDLLLT